MASIDFNEDGVTSSSFSKIIGTSRYHNGTYNNINSFNRFKNYETLDADEGGIAYLFFTRPDMNIDQTFQNELFNSHEMEEIKKYNFRGGRGFMYAITNLGQSFELADDVLKTDSYTQSSHGYKIITGTDYIDSTTEGNFNINYIEDDHLSILKLHKFWVDYIQDVRLGKIKCNPNAMSAPNRNGYLDYVSSAYYFKLLPDGHTIRYWAKYTGVIPTNVPYSSQNWNLGEGGINKPSFSYAYSFKHDMQPWIFEDFNYASGKTEAKVQLDAPSIERNWVDNVCIVRRTNQQTQHPFILIEL